MDGWQPLFVSALGSQSLSVVESSFGIWLSWLSFPPSTRVSTHCGFTGDFQQTPEEAQLSASATASITGEG